MDPIMKLLEEDEDDTLHSGAAVEAFTAALNRDIEGNTSISHSASGAMMPQGSNQMSSLYSQWQPPNQDRSGNNQSQTDLMCLDQQAKHSGELDMKPYISGAESQQQEASAPHAPNELLLQPKMQDSDNDRKEDQTASNISQSSGMQNLEKGRNQFQEPGSLQHPSREPQISNIHLTSASVPEQASRTKQIPFGSLLPIILPELDKDRAMQLQTLYAKLRKNEIPKDGFVRLMRSIVGDQMLKVAVVKMQSKIARESQPGPTQQQFQSQNPMQQHNLRAPVTSSSDPYQFAHLHQRSQDSHGMQVSQMSARPAMAVQGLTKQQQQQNMQFPHTSYPMYGSGNLHSYTASAVNASSAVVKPQPGQGQIPQGFGSSAAGGVTQALGIGASNFERQHPFNDSKRVPSGSVSHMPNNSTGQQNMSWQTSSSEEHKFGAPSSMYVKQEPVDPTNEHQSKPPVTSSHGTSFGQQFEQGSAAPGILNDESLERQPSRAGFIPTTAVPQNSMPSPMAGSTSTDFQAGPQIPSAGPAVMPGSNTKAAPKKSSAGQKKPLDAVGSSPPLPSKKQKVSGAFSDQSIEHLNDVTAVSGVNLREEEEQLFSGPKDDTRASEASRKVVQEEEDKLLLQKLPLQKKLAEIMTKCGLKNLSNDVERCLSLCVEERLRGLLSSMIRISRQRVDSEKSRHRTVVTSDVRQQILAINRKAREEWEKEQAEADKLRRLNEPDNATGIEGDKEKDENRAKSLKVNKEEDDKMRTTAANVAARAAVGGDDMLSKWQLMAEQARQKREGGADAGFNHPGAELNLKNSSSSRNQGTGKKEQSVSPASGAPRRHGRNQSTLLPLEATQNVTVKDVIAVLEREPQTAKSTILYRLYERSRVDASSEQNKGDKG